MFNERVLEVPLTEVTNRCWLAVASLCVPLLWATSACADEADQTATVVERMKELGFEVKDVTPSRIPGLLEVATNEGRVYLSEDANYLIAGNLYELRDGGLVNLTEQQRVAERRELFASVDESDLIIFTPDDGAQASVMVFTDTDCGYCRRLHDQIPNYLAKGIEVRYLAYPRSGVGSPTYDRMVSAWCSDDPRKALTALKRGEGIPEKYCDTHPIGEQYELGQSVGIAGTPAILLPSGRMLPGYAPPDDLAALLGL